MGGFSRYVWSPCNQQASLELRTVILSQKSRLLDDNEFAFGGEWVSFGGEWVSKPILLTIKRPKFLRTMSLRLTMRTMGFTIGEWVSNPLILRCALASHFLCVSQTGHVVVETLLYYVIFKCYESDTCDLA